MGCTCAAQQPWTARLNLFEGLRVGDATSVGKAS